MRYVFHLLYTVPGAAWGSEQTALSEGFDGNLLLQAFGILIAAVVAYVQARGLNLTTRSSLKTDLEILKLLDPADSSYQTVKKAVDKRIARLYSPEPTRPEADMFWSWVFAIFGVLWALGFSYGTFVLLRPAFTWWAVLTGYLAFAGLWLLVMAARGTLMGFLVSLGGRQGIAPTNESTHR